ncbi:site-specific DNA-methyltransferase [Corynebacterium sanguinis]|uniref:site-specific DNA-methyltransferase n=1 Tax=Corynebacterium sanguinis TaxID=2594913 RepID=UPI00223AE08C|nr:site-specific DNA-methyltransferase [Corynebacterium sanguinis]MCT1613509.1 site-specific DNA-methyltransferase [Corynebacterium sanguinis]
MHDELNEIPGVTPDFRTELAEKLADLVPEAVADGKIDTKKLEELLDGDAADTRERFGLFWPGKKRALRAAQESTTATLVPDKENSKDWDTTKNLFIEGDNLEVLKILQKHYHGKIKMIYIDPPYNTGKDFVYPDNYQEGLKSYLEFTKQVDEGGKKLGTNSDDGGRYHSNWLNMMLPRLKLARNLLANDGLAFISIDEHEYDNLSKLCNEVFGESNFIATLIWKKKKGGGNDSKYVAVEHEYVLMVARNVAKLPRLFLAHTEEYLTRYKESDDRGRFFWDTLRRKSGKQYYPITCPDGTVLEQDEHGNPLSWLVSEKRFHEMLEQGDIRFVEGANGWSVHFKQRQPEGKKPRSLLVDQGTTSAGSEEVLELFTKNVFDNPKPSTLIEHLVDIATTGDDIVLDFFSGSATTAHAVMRINAKDGGKRKHIQVQLPEPVQAGSAAELAGYRTISEIARERIVLAAAKLQEDTELQHKIDAGFRTFKLTDTHFSKWRVTSDITQNKLEQHLLSLRESADDQASQEALLTELLLKRGYSLTEQVDVFDVAGLEIHGVKDAEGDYGLLAYLNEHQKPSLEQLRALVDAAEAQVVILEDAFQGDDQLKTNLAQLCKSKGIELWTA